MKVFIITSSCINTQSMYIFATDAFRHVMVEVKNDAAKCGSNFGER